MLPEGFHIELLQVEETRLYLARFTNFEPTDYLEFLTVDELERFQQFGHFARQQEFVATRLLRHSVFGFSHIHYDAHGAPFVEQEGFISISHCRNAVALALNPSYKIGLDLEMERSNILALSSKFLSEHEKVTFDVQNPRTVTKIWSAKEALYKLAGRKKIHFKTELLLDMDENGAWLGRIENPDACMLVKLNIFELDDLIVSINCAPLVEEKSNS